MKHLRINFFLTLALLLTPITAIAQSPCPRFAAGSTVTNPPALFSQNGALTVNLLTTPRRTRTGGRSTASPPRRHRIADPSRPSRRPSDRPREEQSAEAKPGQRDADGNQRRDRMRRGHHGRLVGQYPLSRHQHVADLSPGRSIHT